MKAPAPPQPGKPNARQPFEIGGVADATRGEEMPRAGDAPQAGEASHGRSGATADPAQRHRNDLGRPELRSVLDRRRADAAVAAIVERQDAVAGPQPAPPR